MLLDYVYSDTYEYYAPEKVVIAIIEWFWMR
jgi:hypothetical protein